MTTKSKAILLVCLTMLLYLGMASTLWAAPAGPVMPWDGPLEILARALTTRTARILAIFGIFGATFAFIFFEVGRAVKWFLSVILGASLAASAFNVLALFGIVSALV